MIEDILKRRNNITFFRKDKIPEKEQINGILEKAFALTPHKNNFWHYQVYVFGPEHAQSKKNLAISSVCNKHLRYYRQYDGNEVSEKDWKTLKNRYQDWHDYYNGDKTKEHVIKDKWHFNEQVTAPYLLAYCPAKTRSRPSQVESEYFQKRAEKVFYDPYRVEKNQYHQQSGINAMVVSMLALEQGLDVSFCKCFFYNENVHSDISLMNPAFVLGIGYRDSNKEDLKTWIRKPKCDEVITWV